MGRLGWRPPAWARDLISSGSGSGAVGFVVGAAVGGTALVVGGLTFIWDMGWYRSRKSWNEAGDLETLLWLIWAVASGFAALAAGAWLASVFRRAGQGLSRVSSPVVAAPVTGAAVVVATGAATAVVVAAVSLILIAVAVWATIWAFIAMIGALVVIGFRS